jgi:hypothetical protein
MSSDNQQKSVAEVFFSLIPAVIIFLASLVEIFRVSWWPFLSSEVVRLVVSIAAVAVGVILGLGLSRRRVS